MKFTIETDAMLDNKTNISEVLALLTVVNNIDIQYTIDRIYSKGYICKGIDNKFILTDSGIELLDKVNISADKNVPKNARLINLAKKMKEIYPKGMKDGKYPWQSSEKDISIYLGRFFIRYPEITDEQIIDATKRYVEHFGEENNKGMRTLKYFILKNEKKPFVEDGNLVYKIVEVSDLISWIENKEDDEVKEELLFTNLI